ncbi:DUF421 domain-containing protein [Paenibacillus sambharensis]|uniref:DUF421 domain-containing protein n=1 Tax=Paenibacillus sambharensis TaxID=1803190 RepID=A0A2W1LWX7_9BACL|nr:YetF domain-containing protein [Paenibacillus sambharensis]PZD96271.1 DUF421 domain-containing protein [Paenibacillus sambharensis]
MFFDSWMDLLRILVIGVLAYVYLVILVRVAGKRTLSKMNAFDLVVTVAIGSTLATVVLNKDISLTEGILALTLLVGLQYLVAWSAVRSDRFEEMIKSEPQLLYYKGEFRREAMRKERVVENEVMQYVRTQGMMELDQVEAVILETNGKMSVIKK